MEVSLLPTTVATVATVLSPGYSSTYSILFSLLSLLFCSPRPITLFVPSTVCNLAISRVISFILHLSLSLLSSIFLSSCIGNNHWFFYVTFFIALFKHNVIQSDHRYQPGIDLETKELSMVTIPVKLAGGFGLEGEYNNGVVAVLQMALGVHRWEIDALNNTNTNKWLEEEITTRFLKRGVG